MLMIIFLIITFSCTPLPSKQDPLVGYGVNKNLRVISVLTTVYDGDNERITSSNKEKLYVNFDVFDDNLYVVVLNNKLDTITTYFGYVSDFVDKPEKSCQTRQFVNTKGEIYLNESGQECILDNDYEINVEICDDIKNQKMNINFVTIKDNISKKSTTYLF